MVMATQQQKSSHSISSILGPRALLPGETEADYEAGIRTLIDELKVSSPLQVFLVEQIYESMMWIRRLNGEKRELIIRKMAEELGDFGGYEGIELYLRKALNQSKNGQYAKWLAEKLEEKDFTLETLESAATRRALNTLEQIDRSIRAHFATIQQLQRSLDAAEMKPLLKRRMELQIGFLERDMNAIEHDKSA
jgi:hypothetical protein